MRLIDAEILKESINDWELTNLYIGDVMNCIDRQQVIDIFPVLCGDCKHFESTGDYFGIGRVDGFGECKLHKISNFSDCYCNHGVRKDGD